MIELYGVEVGESRDPVAPLTMNVEQARTLAIAQNGRLVAYKFVLDDSELVDDYTAEPAPLCSACGRNAIDADDDLCAECAGCCCGNGESCAICR